MPTATQPKIERRFAPSEISIERREDGTARLRGHAAVWYRKSDAGTQYDLGYSMVERIAKGAFSRAIQEKQDVRALFNHDPSSVLGRTASGTLTLREDAQGLLYEIDLPDTQLARDLAASIERGDITGSSFSFRVGTEEWKREKDHDVRTIKEIEQLFDVGPVTFPAYTSTDTGMRAEGDCQEAAAARDAWRRRVRQARNRRLAALCQFDLD